MIKYSFKRAIGRTPKTLPYKNGAFVAFLNASIDRASLSAARNFTAKATQTVLARAGLGTEAELAQWATLVEEVEERGEARREESRKNDEQGQVGWRGLWIPFQNGSPLEGPPQKGDNPAVKGGQGRANTFNPSQGSDLVILHAHGGGFINGNASSKVPFWLGVMDRTFTIHGTKISVLSLEYSKSSSDRAMNR